MKSIKLYKNGLLYFEGTCEITEIEDVIIEQEEPEEKPEGKIYLKDWITHPEPISIKQEVKTKLPYYVYAGVPQNRWLWKEYADIIDLILISLHLTFKGRECEFTGAYDACGSGVNHPGGSHKFSDTNGRTIDLSYWTLTGDCFTQQWNIPNEYSWTQLWKSSLIDTHFVKTFDWERFYTFATRLKEVLPNAVISVDQRIKDYVYQRVRFTHGEDAISKMAYLHGDTPELWYHHQHMHIVLDLRNQTINWDANIRHWWG